MDSEEAITAELAPIIHVENPVNPSEKMNIVERPSFDCKIEDRPHSPEAEAALQAMLSVKKYPTIEGAVHSMSHLAEVKCGFPTMLYLGNSNVNLQNNKNPWFKAFTEDFMNAKMAYFQPVTYLYDKLTESSAKAKVNHRITPIRYTICGAGDSKMTSLKESYSSNSMNLIYDLSTIDKEYLTTEKVRCLSGADFFVEQKINPKNIMIVVVDVGGEMINDASSRLASLLEVEGFDPLFITLYRSFASRSRRSKGMIDVVEMLNGMGYTTWDSDNDNEFGDKLLAVKLN